MTEYHEQEERRRGDHESGACPPVRKRTRHSRPEGRGEKGRIQRQHRATAASAQLIATATSARIPHGSVWVICRCWHRLPFGPGGAGEILLVVIGILIALQNNNLNEDCIERRQAWESDSATPAISRR